MNCASCIPIFDVALFANFSLQEDFGHVVGAPKDKSSDGSVLLASLHVLACLHVGTGGLDVLIDLDTVQDHVVLGIDDQVHGVEESLAHRLEFREILSANLGAVS